MGWDWWCGGRLSTAFSIIGRIQRFEVFTSNRTGILFEHRSLWDTREAEQDAETLTALAKKKKSLVKPQARKRYSSNKKHPPLGGQRLRDQAG